MTSTVVLDALPEQAARYRHTHAIVAVDVFRATTTIVTALAAGRRVYPVASLEEAQRIAKTLHNPLLAGEQTGTRPNGFELNNSPAAIASRNDTRPLVLLSSAGTRLLANAHGAVATYVACFRNLSATAAHVRSRCERVAIIGAGTRGEPRIEDQMAASWMAERLLAAGFEPENDETAAEIAHWRRADIHLIGESPSALYLRTSGQEEDIAFVLARVDDLDAVAVVRGLEVTLEQPTAPAVATASSLQP